MGRTKSKTKRIADFPKAYRDTYAYFHAFTRLGFATDDLFVGFGAVGNLTDVIHVYLATQGKTFTVSVAQLVGVPHAKVMRTWRQFAALVNKASQADREACFRDHLIGSSVEYFAMLTTMIQEKGILVPEVMRMAAVGQA